MQRRDETPVAFASGPPQGDRAATPIRGADERAPAVDRAPPGALAPPAGPRLRRWVGLGLVAGAAAALACARPSPEPAEARSAEVAAAGQGAGGPAGGAAGPAATASGEGVGVAPNGAGAPGGAWVAALRAQRWADAAAGLDALPEATRTRPAERFARAVAAARLGDPAAVVTLLRDLEAALPVLRTEIAEARALAQVEVGPFAEAARWFGARTDARSRLLAARAEERAGRLKEARALLDPALTPPRGKRRGAKRDAELLADLRLARARVAAALGDGATARADLLQVAREAPGRADDAATLAALGALKPPLALSAADHLDRAERLAARGDVDGTQRELEQAGAAAGRRGRLARADAWYHSRRDDAEAARLLTELAAERGADAASLALRAARAHVRAGNDAAARKLLERLAAPRASGVVAERARLGLARLAYARGEWAAAVRGYDRYLKQHPRGGEVEEARYERAVALLAGARAGEASTALRALRPGADGPRETAELELLIGIADQQRGKKRDAAARFRQLLVEQPLSFAALAATERLRQLGDAASASLGAGAGATAPSGAAAPAEVALPPRAALLASLGLDELAESALAAEEPALRAKHGPSADQAICDAYAALGVAARRYQHGQRAVDVDVLRTAPGPESRWAWECLYPRPYLDQLAELAQDRGAPVDYVLAIMRQESGFRPGVVSPAQAVGLMQLIPPTAASVARELGLTYDPARLTAPDYNLRLGSYYLKKVLDTFGGELALAAAAYNAGPRAVSRWLEGGEELPLDLWVARIPYEETRHYVHRVVGNAARYAYLAGAAELPRVTLTLPRGLRAGADAY